MPFALVKRVGLISTLTVLFIFLIALPSVASSIMYGDVNGDGVINIHDSVLVNKYIMGTETLTEEQKMAADVNGDGVVNVLDATLISRMFLGLIYEFPAEAGPTLVLPKDNAKIDTTSVHFKWEASDDATRYQLEVTRADDDTIFKREDLGNVTSYVLAGFPVEGTEYNWRIRAGNDDVWGNWSLHRSFINGNVPSPPSLRLPGDQANAPSTAVNFEWAASSGANKYELEIRRANDNTLIRNVTLGNTTTTLQYGFTVDGEQYKWRVRAGNDAGWSEWSDFRTFNNGPTAPVLLTPTSGANVGTHSINFTWQPVTGANRYQLEIIKADDRTVFIDKSLGNVTSSLQAGFKSEGTNYRWRVRAGNHAGWGEWSGYRTFVNGARPTAPKLKAPANNATTDKTFVMFEWERVSGATRYELDIRYGSSTYKNVVLGDTTATILRDFPDEQRLYSWRVRAGNDSGWGSYSEVRYLRSGDLLFAPAQISPANFVYTPLPSQIEFEWAQSVGASKYELQVRRVRDNVLFRHQELSGGNTVSAKLSFPDDYGDQYKWRIRAGSISGWGEWSMYKHFINDNPPAGTPEAPVLTMPTDGAYGRGFEFNFEWDSPSSGPNPVAGYELEIRWADDGGLFVRDHYDDSPATVVYLPNDGSHFYWRVRGINDSGPGRWTYYKMFVNGDWWDARF